MNPRYEPGGDKHDEIREDAKYNFYESVQADKDVADSIRFRVRSWTNNEIDNHDEPTYHNFIAEYPEYRAEAWESLIEQEIDRTVKESYEHSNFGLPFFSKASQG